MDILSSVQFDPAALLEATGYIGLFLIVFAESGLFFGFFLPGDSLLFAAGLLAFQGIFQFPFLLFLVIIAAILGDNIGYWFGKKVGPHLFTKEESFFFHPKHVERTKAFYERHGAKTIILARFIPIVRTYAPILAGVGSMRYQTFLKYNVLGGLLWGTLMLSAGYFLVRLFPAIEDYLTLVILGIIVLSFLPIIHEFLRVKKAP